MTKSRIQIALAVFTFVVIWLQGRMNIWNGHAQIDMWVFWERFNYYLTHGNSFAGLHGNEILPATLMFMFAPALLIPTGTLGYITYLPAMMLINMVVLLVHYHIAKNKNFFLALLLFFGPILLFRFDGLVLLFLCMSFVSFENEKYPMAGVLLGFATGMKVFPIIFLPYMILILLRQKKIKQMFALLVFFVEAILLPVLIFLMLGGSLDQIKEALAFHGQKLISIESLPGSIITGLALMRDGAPPALIPGTGIWAVAGPSILLNKLWVLPLSIMYVVIMAKKKLLDNFNWVVPYTLMLVFLIVSKNLNPQYMWWFMAFVPFLKMDTVSIVMILIAALLNQLVFPLFYTTFIDGFYKFNQSHWIYYLALLRNLLLLVVSYKSVRKLLNE
jgi:uncharacterized membrane protein